jgi:hypothetical protein
LLGDWRCCVGDGCFVVHDNAIHRLLSNHRLGSVRLLSNDGLGGVRLLSNGIGGATSLGGLLRLVVVVDVVRARRLAPLKFARFAQHCNEKSARILHLWL